MDNKINVTTASHEVFGSLSFLGGITWNLMSEPFILFCSILLSFSPFSSML